MNLTESEYKAVYGAAYMTPRLGGDDSRRYHFDRKMREAEEAKRAMLATPAPHKCRVERRCGRRHGVNVVIEWRH